MKKIFQIATYDFRRLMLNPFSILALLLVLVACLILGAVYKLPTTPAYTAVTAGNNAQEIFDGFYSNDEEIDTKISLDKMLQDTQNMINVQLQEQSPEYSELEQINEEFSTIKTLVLIWAMRGEIDFAEIVSATDRLTQFLENYNSLGEFESRLILTKAQHKELSEINDYFVSVVHSNKSVQAILEELFSQACDTKTGHFDTLNNFVKNHGPVAWRVDKTIIEQLQTEIVDKAVIKANLIQEELNRIKAEGSYEAQEADMKSLITNYKLTCQSANFVVKTELENALKADLGNLDRLYGYQKAAKEETSQELTKAKYFLKDKSLYYTTYQEPLNFNIASTEITAYDNSYFIISIIGFFTIIFGIFAAYKLFGRDRKNGKMDVILSQDVTFGQVFAGKFTAIVLCTCFILGVFMITSLLWAMLFYAIMPGSILAIFNLTSAYTINPFLFLLIKVVGIELQVVFYSMITIFLMNISRRFELTFGIALLIFAAATICNIFLNNLLVYCLFPFIHADLTSFLGGGVLHPGFLQTGLYASGNFFISLAYYAVVVVLLYNFTNQLFKKN